MQNVHLARASKIFTGFVILISSFRPQPHPPDRRWYDQLRIYKYTFWHANYIQMTNYFKIISRTGRCWGNWNNWHTYRGNADILHVADCYTDYVLRSLKYLFAALSCYYGALPVAPDSMIGKASVLLFLLMFLSEGRGLTWPPVISLICCGMLARWRLLSTGTRPWGAKQDFHTSITTSAFWSTPQSLHTFQWKHYRKLLMTHEV